MVLFGLLLVITPDSNSVNKSARRIAGWRTAIESCGFRRWKYEKLEHAHCMAFRSVPREAEVGEAPGNATSLIRIPQDAELSVSDS